MKSARYLTPKLKTHVLAEWKTIKQRYASSGITNPTGGRGYPDPLIFDWCDRLNRIPTLVTLQSCTGHKVSEDHIYSGNFWLWLSEEASELFDPKAFELYEQFFIHPKHGNLELISEVRRFYQQYGQEVTSINFRGLEESTEVFEASMNHISEFFERLLFAVK